jgi:hypothetical protein
MTICTGAERGDDPGAGGRATPFASPDPIGPMADSASHGKGDARESVGLKEHRNHGRERDDEQNGVPGMDLS